MCHAINVSQSDFTGKYLRARYDSIERNDSTLAVSGMSAKSDLIHTMKAISANPA